MAQLAYHVSTGTDMWGFQVQKGSVLYLALEDDYDRLQKRLYKMFGVETAKNLYFGIEAPSLGDGLIDLAVWYGIRLQERRTVQRSFRCILMSRSQRMMPMMPCNDLEN